MGIDFEWRIAVSRRSFAHARRCGDYGFTSRQSSSPLIAVGWYCALLICAGLHLGSVSQALAVEVFGGGPYTNNTPPSPTDPGFYNVGYLLGAASCTYLGNGWVLVNNHENPSPRMTTTFLVINPITGKREPKV